MSFLYVWMPESILLLRLAVGAIFLVHGPPKLKHGAQMAPMLGMSSGMVWLVGLVETLGAISVIVGFLTPIGALALAVIMVGALYFKIAKWHMPFTAMDKTGWELDLVILASALILATGGASIWSIDGMITGIG